jgi:hypothetical protein
MELRPTRGVKKVNEKQKAVIFYASGILHPYPDS